MVVREFRAGDEPGIQSTVKEVYDEYGFTWDPGEYHADLYDIEAYYPPSTSQIWVAEVDGRIDGVGGVTTHDLVPGETGGVVMPNGKVRVAGTDAELVRLYVRPSARCLGIGSEITRRVIDEARRRGRSAIEIWSDKRFEAAHRLYQRFGARLVGERVCDDPDESPEWGLILPLGGNL